MFDMTVCMVCMVCMVFMMGMECLQCQVSMVCMVCMACMFGIACMSGPARHCCHWFKEGGAPDRNRCWLKCLSNVTMVFVGDIS